MQTLRSVRGMTLIELMIVIAMIGLMAAIVVPRLRVSKATLVRQAADQLVRDLEQARTRALSTRSRVRVVFTPGTNNYAGYLDWNRDTLFAQNQEESDSLRAFRPKTLPDQVAYGRGGSVPDVPNNSGGGSITFTGSRLELDTRGLTTPFGARGVIYLTHPQDATAQSAVTVSASGSIRRWNYIGGTWR
jgi:prepilin-type N-terminal cleavage/methylation domain-containing protein